MPEQRSSLFISNPIRLASTPAPPPTYTGPGDVVVSAVGWWGLRAYSAASIGSNIIRLREDGGNTEMDFPSISGGGLNLAAISSFKGANNLFVVTLYDQVSTNHLTQATAGNQPGFTLSAIGSLPAIQFIAANSTGLSNTPTMVAQSQPYTLSTVFNNNNDTGAQAALWIAGSFSELGVHRASANDVFIYSGDSVPTATANASTWHALQGVYNNASSDIYVDGSSNSSNLGGSTGFNSVISLGSFVTLSEKYGGFIGEIGLWGSAFNGTQESNMNSNQHSYWGF